MMMIIDEDQLKQLQRRYDLYYRRDQDWNGRPILLGRGCFVIRLSDGSICIDGPVTAMERWHKINE